MRPEQIKGRTAALVGTASVLFATCVYVLRLDRAAGLMVDDAWYVLLARALARGQGFRLVSSAASPILPVVPPGFPAILSIVFQFSPEFPRNIVLLKSVSIAAMMAVAVLSYRYVVNCRHVPWQLGLGISAATVLTPGFVFLATSSVMAECVFTLGQLSTIIVVEQSLLAGNETVRRRQLLLAGALAAATTLVRSAGVALVGAAVLYLIRKQGWKRTALFGGTAAICLLPWTFYALAHQPTDAQRREHGGSIAYAYSDSIRMKQAADLQSGRATLRDLGDRVRANVVNVFGRDVGGVFVPALFRGPEESGEEVVALGGLLGLTAGSMGNAPATMVLSFVLSALALIGFGRAVRTRLTLTEILVPASSAMIVTLPFFTFRYVLPLTPFLLFYLADGVRTATVWFAHRLRRPSHDAWRAARMVMLCIVGLDVLDHAQYIMRARDVQRAYTLDWVADADEVDGLLNWMKQTLLSEGGVATTNPALVYLSTGRKTLAIDDYDGNWRRWKAGGVRYAVALRPANLPDASYGYRILYQSSRRKLWVIEL